MQTQQQIKEKAAVITGILTTIGDIVKGNNGTPSGTLYAALMQYGCSLSQYNGIIDAFKSCGKIKEVHNELFWIA